MGGDSKEKTIRKYPDESAISSSLKLFYTLHTAQWHRLLSLDRQTVLSFTFFFFKKKLHLNLIDSHPLSIVCIPRSTNSNVLTFSDLQEAEELRSLCCADSSIVFEKIKEVTGQLEAAENQQASLYQRENRSQSTL